jgi:hypothetical protein
MKNLLLILGFLAFLPLTMFSQASTFHQKYEGTYGGAYPVYGDWTIQVRWKTTVNQVRKTTATGDTEIKYTNNYNAHWEYYNTVTGEKKVGPENQNVTGVYTFNATSYTNDRHWVYHYVNDPVFGAYHINFNLFWGYNPATGFMEVMDIQNEWLRNP